MLEQFEIYINAQKTMAQYLLGLGVLMIAIGVVVHFSGSIPHFKGLKIGLLICGLLAIVGGYGYRITEEKLLNSHKLIYHEDPIKFKQVELERMQKVVKSYPKIQITFVVVIIAALITILFLNKPLVNGLLFSLVIYMVGNLLLENISKPSIYTYLEQLTTVN